MRIAVIDLGTNTFNLLIADVFEDGRSEFVYKTRIPVKIGEGGINKGFIIEAAMKRAYDAIKEYSIEISQFKVDKVRAFGTSALRSASNGQDFIDRIQKDFNINIELIDGDQEAELIYHGVKNAIELTTGTYLIMDVGGGSTEFIIANQDGILWKKSFKAGAARLLQFLKPSDPMSKADIETLEKHISELMEPLFEECKKHNFESLIGCSGCFSSFAEMIEKEKMVDETFYKLKGYEFDLNSYKNLHQKLIESTYLQRLEIPGLIKMRADMIAIGTVLVNYVIDRLKIEKFMLSRYALKEGVLDVEMNGGFENI